jgi:hypothetical protein
MHRQRHQTALERPELRLSTSPRVPAAGATSMAIKPQRTPEQDAAIERYLEAKRLAQIGQDFARDGIELVEEGLERAGAKRVSAS